MTTYRLVAQPRADFDVVGAYRWYEDERVASAYSFSRSYALRTIESPKIHSGINSWSQESAVLWCVGFPTRSTSRSTHTLSSSLQCFMWAAIRPNGNGADGLSRLAFRHLREPTQRVDQPHPLDRPRPRFQQARAGDDAGQPARGHETKRSA